MTDVRPSRSRSSRVSTVTVRDTASVSVGVTDAVTTIRSTSGAIEAGVAAGACGPPVPERAAIRRLNVAALSMQYVAYPGTPLRATDLRPGEQLNAGPRLGTLVRRICAARRTDRTLVRFRPQPFEE